MNSIDLRYARSSLNLGSSFRLGFRFGAVVGTAAAVTAAVTMAACTHERPTVTVVEPLRPVTSEEKGNAAVTIEVILSEAPDADVVFTVASSRPEVGMPDVSELRFTPANGDQPQSFTVTGQDDGSGANTDAGAIDYEINFGVAQSSDEAWAGVQPSSVRLRNLDNEVAYTLKKIEELEEDEPAQGWLLIEDPDAPLILELALKDEPFRPVTVTFDLYKGGTEKPPIFDDKKDKNVSFEKVTPDGLAVYQTKLSFEPSNYNQPQRIQIFAVDDGDSIDPGKIFDLAVSMAGDLAYLGLPKGTFPISNLDLDSASIVAAPASVCLNEGGSAKIDISITESGIFQTTINIVMTDLEGVTINPRALTFGASDSTQTQQFTITSANDSMPDDLNGILSFQVSGEANNPFVLAYADVPPAPVEVRVIDNDRGGQMELCSSGVPKGL